MHLRAGFEITNVLHRDLELVLGGCRPVGLGGRHGAQVVARRSVARSGFGAQGFGDDSFAGRGCGTR